MGIVDSAQRLIAKNGRAVSYVTVTPGAYDPATSRAAVTKTTRTVKCVVESWRTRESTDDNALRGETELRLIFAGADFKTPPKMADLVVIDGIEFAVVGMLPAYYRDTAVTYSLHARRT